MLFQDDATTLSLLFGKAGTGSSRLRLARASPRFAPRPPRADGLDPRLYPDRPLGAED